MIDSMVMVKLWMLMLGVSCLILSLGIYNLVSNLLIMPLIGLSLPYLIIVVFSVVRRPWLKSKNNDGNETVLKDYSGI